MKRISVFLLPIFLLQQFVTICQVSISMEGPIIIGPSESPSPVAGTIQWTGIDILGYNGHDWLSMSGGAIKDIDNNTYPIVVIGSQIWMAENLRVSRYNDGSPIPIVMEDMDWNNLTTPAYTWFGNGGAPERYGALYNYYAVADTQTRNICPNGWHIPDSADWNILIEELGGLALAGAQLKAGGNADWIPPNEGATNTSGFTALPGGARNIGGGFISASNVGYYWSGSEISDSHARSVTLTYFQSGVVKSDLSKKYGMSVRCLKD